MRGFSLLLDKARNCVKKNGKVNLAGENITSLKELGTLKLMNSLDLSYSTIYSIEGLKVQPNLKTFIADKSSLTSFKNFFSIGTVTKISLKETPISEMPTFLLNIAIVLPNVTIVNDKILPNSIRNKARKYPKEAAMLINAGWIATYPVPDDDEFTKLLVKYNINVRSEDFEQMMNIEEEDIDEFDYFRIINSVNEDERLDAMLNNFYAKHDKIVSKAKRYCGFEVAEGDDIDEEEDTEEDVSEPTSSINSIKKVLNNELLMDDFDKETNLLARISEILKENGYEIDPDDEKNSILTLIEKMCDLE